MGPGLIVLVVVVLLVIVVLVKAVLVVPQAQASVVERLGRFRTVAAPGLNFLMPFLDRVRARSTCASRSCRSHRSR